MKKRSKYVPALTSTDPYDTGSQYMIARHRFMIAEKFGYSPKEVRINYQTKEEQNMMLVALKTEDPEKYNNIFNYIVRGDEPKVVENKIDIPDDILDNMKRELNKYVSESKEIVIAKADQVAGKLIEISESIKVQANNWEKHLADYAKQKVDEETKKLNKVEIVIKTPTKKEISIKDPIPKQFEDVIDLATQRLNILLIGPSGCGKTKLSYMVAEALDMDFAAQSCSEGMSESSFTGWLLPIEENGRFVYVQSEFVRLYENGGMFLFDEIDAADSNTLLFLNQALANDRFYLPQRHEKPMIKRHKDFVAIAAANTYGNGATALYSGRNILDAATMDRFRMGIIAMDYSEEVEEALVDPLVLEWGRTVRRIINHKSLRKIMSTRLLIDASKMKNESSWTFEKIARAYFSDWNKEEKRMVMDDETYRNKYLLTDDEKSSLSQDQRLKIINLRMGVV